MKKTPQDIGAAERANERVDDGANVTNVVGLFQRAASAHVARADRVHPPAVHSLRCPTCGAPRSDSSLLCRYCGTDL